MPTLIDAGETWSSPTYEVRDSAGALTSTVTVTAIVTLPDGTTSSPAAANPGVGLFTVDYLTTAAAATTGAHDVVVTATGGALGSVVRKWSDAFVTVAPGGLLVGADDALTHLRAQKVITGAADTDQLRWLCYVATAAIAGDLGRAVVRETVTEQHDGGRPSLRLRRTPVRSVSVVTENGVALSTTDGVDWTLDAQPRTGLLWRGTSSATTACPSKWAAGRKNVTVTYGAGPVSSPVVRWVALEAIARMWQSSQQAGHPLLDEGAAEAAVFSAVADLPSPDRAAYDNLRAAGGMGLA